MARGGHERASSSDDESVYPSDPLGLLESVPELELFLRDRRVRGAIERGRPHDVYRALFWARLFGGHDAERRATLSALLRERRLFVAPLRGAPAMFTYNGVGLAVYGSAEHRGDGAYIGTHYLVLLFVPIFPLGSYLMSNAGGRSYRFFGRAPFGVFDWLFNRLVVLGLVGAVLFGLTRSVVASQYADLHVVNGLPFAVAVDVCGQRLEVDTHDRVVVTTPVGDCRLMAWSTSRASEPPIEITQLHVEPGHDVAAWNVLGMAPIYDEVVTYGTALDAPAGHIHCGEPLVVLDGVDHPFTDPPTSISSSRRGGETRTHVGVAEGVLDCVSHVLAEAPAGSETRERMLAAVPVVARASGYLPEPTLALAGQLTMAEEHEAALALVRAARDVHDDRLDLHVEYQNLMLTTGRRAEALAEYRARAEGDERADAHYLAERLDVAPGSLDRWLRLHALFPDHPQIHAALAHGYCDASMSAEGSLVFDELAAAHPDLAAQRVTVLAPCLFAAGRGLEARSLVEEAFHAAPPGISALMCAVLHHELSAALDPPLASSLLDTLPPDRRSALVPLFLAQTRQDGAGPSGDPDLDQVVEMLVAARTDPERAIAAWRRIPVWVHFAVPGELLVLLAGERPGALGLLSALGPENAEAIRSLVATGVEPDLLTSFDRGLRAAAWMARSRQPDLSPEVRAAARSRAYELAVLPGWIRTAEGWPER